MQGLLEDSDNSLLDMMPDDFPYDRPSHLRENADVWGTETELNGDMAVLPMSTLPKMDPSCREDFHKVLCDWQDHLGSMQVSDSEDMDVKDIVGMDIEMPGNFPENLPDNIFEETSYEKEKAPSSSDNTKSFEASEKFNSSSPNAGSKPSVLDTHLFAMATQQVSPKPVSAPERSLATPSKLANLSHQNIRDSLPKEVIDRIKVSGSSGGESVQLDHDYCTVLSGEIAPPPRSFYHSDATEYTGTDKANARRLVEHKQRSVKDKTYSRLPEYYMALSPQKKLVSRRVGSNEEECWEKNAKKDSGLESGDMSDASEETVLSSSGVSKCHVANIQSGVKSSLLVRSNSTNSESSLPEVIEIKEEPQEPKKRKLNLEQYRSRLKELGKVYGTSSCDSSHNNSPVPSPSPFVVTSVSVGTETGENAGVDGGSSISRRSCNEVESYVSKDELREKITCPPSVCSVEVQTELNTVEGDQLASEDKTVKRRKERSPSVYVSRSERARDRRHRQYRSRRASSSSSSASSSSSNSHRRFGAHSRRKWKRSERCSSITKSVSSSGSRGRGVWSRSRSRSSSSSRSSSNSRSRSRSPIRSTSNNWPLSEQEKQRQVEERRVIYVGRIDEGTTKAELRRRFEAFGPIIDISVHFREHGDNYGFVTFAYKMDAYDAVEHGNDNPNLPKYDLCFGGRRAFCKTRYADLDGMATSSEPRSHGSSAVWVSRSLPQTENSFDLLLREAKAKIKKRKV
uniref:RRM domain-containing protein n=1 Tax=Timema shepardi TaxID=629360 RepID=A0A7R9AXR8_TIMSH|nr:unnamed protein product [Timema shepardi]